ncbi:hypothetical protein BDZ97DRAFT_1752873 [Flammula alnicola]|nr:hypothetical protein BDZ97DRAFT_1752873 [Flammula alnicola]
MRRASTAVDFVEDMAQKQIKYETIFGEQAEVLRSDLPKFDAAMAQLQKSPLVAKRGQRWEPTQDNVDEYLARCDEICHLVPQDFDELTHGALMCLVTCKIAQQHDRVQLAILKRHNELAMSVHPTPPIQGNREAPLSKPMVEPRHITAEELRLFRDPENLHGKQFVLSANNDSGMYEVIGYSRKRDRTVEYDVLFDDCGDPIMVNAKEMMAMLEDSLYLPA